eukprot:TRINITY_DN5621_c0_g2_i1.p3 TRINITY_DN5621_c0_g2~~TRINITY_DN5621_c0_g2_i1.p3  ORF type:complete len:137 (+),score=18.49 TRINITY_DN5621_c0_g2_i1:63-473(+)
MAADASWAEARAAVLAEHAEGRVALAREWLAEMKLSITKFKVAEALRRRGPAGADLMPTSDSEWARATGILQMLARRREYTPDPEGPRLGRGMLERRRRRLGQLPPRSTLDWHWHWKEAVDTLVHDGEFPVAAQAA